MSRELIQQAPELLSVAFERLCRSTDSSVEQTQLQRAINEAVAAAPGDLETTWSRWLLDAGRATGLKIDEFTATVDAAFDLAGSGMALLTWDGASQRFLLLRRSDRGRVQSVWCDGQVSAKRTSPRKLAVELAKRDRARSLNWIAVDAGSFRETNLAGSPSDHGHDHGSHSVHPSPLTRLWQMVQPEFSDVGILLVVGLAVALLATAVPIAGQQLVRTVTFGTLYQPIIVLSMLLLMFLGFMGALQAMSVVVVELIQRRLFARTVADLSLRLPRADFMALQTANGPELINRFLDITTVQKVVAGLLVDGLALVLTTVIGMTLLAFYHPFLLGYNLLLLALLLVVVLILGRGGTQTAISESFEKYRIAGWLEEMARCPLAFRLAGGANFALARADRLTAGYLHARHRHFRVLIRQILSLFAIQALASTTLLGLGGYLVMHEQLTLGQLVAAELIVTMIVGSFAKLAKHIEGFFDLMAAMDKLGHVIDLPLERGGHSLRVLPDVPLAELRSARFALRSESDHATRSQSVKGTPLSIESGQHLAVLGKSGSGKSHLADLLYGLKPPTDGTVLIGGCDVRELTPEVLRRHVALIRSVEVIAGSLEENVHFGRSEVDSAQIRLALQLAALHDEVASLSDGLHCVLTNDGGPLSGSQQARLMIARALAGRPKLLVIDGLVDQLPDDLLNRLLANLLGTETGSTLLVFTGREDVAKRFPRTVTLIDHHETTGAHSSKSFTGH
jgi:ABC-type bacteriocin/lantibiotic exporter with double-glycine peptidase domain